MPEPHPTAATVVVSEPPTRAYVRSPVTVVRLLGVLALAALVTIPLRHAAGSDFSTLFGDLLASAPRWLVSAVVATAQLGFLVPAILGLLALVAQRRFVRLGRMLLATVVAVAGLIAMSKIVGSASFHLLPGLPHTGAATSTPPTGRPSRYGIGAPFPTVLDLGVIAAWMFIDAPHWSPRWRRIGRIVLVLGLLARLGVALADPADIVATVVVAAAAAQLVHLVAGVPNTRPRASTVGAILGRLGYDLASVEPSDRFRGFAGFRALRTDGGEFFVKIVSRDSWATSCRSASTAPPGSATPARTARSVPSGRASSTRRCAR